MRVINTEIIKEKVKEALLRANFELDPDFQKLLEKALNEEQSLTGREVLRDLIENMKIAKRERIPLCQDTGMVNFYVEMGQEIKLEGDLLNNALNDAVREVYTENYLRPSVVEDPLKRKNTGDNTPAIIHLELVPGDKLTIYIMPKGGGSEQMCKLAMLAPHEGVEGVKKFILSAILEAGPNPCPPVVIGIGIGGNFDLVSYLAKKALLREFGKRNEDPFYAGLEMELLKEINDLGLGPGGLGGRFYALDVRIEKYPTHIAQLPVAVAFNCNSFRLAKIII